MYWVVIAAASDVNTFSWVRSDPSVIPTGSGATYDSQAISTNGDTGWEDGTDPHSIAVNGSSVPEPGAWVLVGVGLGVVGWMVSQVLRAPARGHAG